MTAAGIPPALAFDLRTSKETAKARVRLRVVRLQLNRFFIRLSRASGFVLARPRKPQVVVAGWKFGC